MFKKALIVLGVLIILIPPALFFGIKLSPLNFGLLGSVNESSGLALQGYDPVAYFTEGKAVKGDTTNGIRQDGVIYYFSSDANKLMFKTFPEKFVPQYGGYCATAVSTGFTADVNPETWYMEDNKLYLFLSESSKNDFVNTIDEGIIEIANGKWNHRKL